jgi:photosystem II stability/assembly factor-like uncharacterized protein
LYATGNNLFASTYLNLYRSTDKGKTWIQVDTGGTGNIVAFYFSKTKQTLLAAGPMGLFASSDNGLTWEKSSTFPSQYIHSATTRGDSILVGVDSGLFCSYNNGNTWELLNKGLRDSIVTCNMATEVGLFAGTRDGFYSFDAAIKTWGPKNDGLTNRGPITLNSIGSDLFAGTFEGAFLSRDSCKTWSDIHDIPFQAIVLDLAATPNNNLIACTSDKGMFFSKDKGNTWASKGNDLPEILWTVEQFNNRLYAGSEGKGLYTSTDEGENWTSVPTGFAFDFTIYAIASLGNNLFLGTDKGLLISYDKGTNWGLNADLMFAIFTICVNKNRIFVAGDGGAVYFSDDTATTWTAGKGLMANYIEDLDAKASTVFAASPSDGIFASTDNGETWNLIQDNIKNKQAYALAIQDEYIYLGIYGGGVWRRKISEITPGVREDADIPFFTVYPNPSNGILNIKTFMSMDHIELMNPLGQFYYLAPSTAYETQLDLSKHPKGIYIIRVISRNGKGSSRKIILQ